jgi:cytochrome c biogenesis protein CcdA/thiol-disulfide isomerase/thioredoxin
MLTFALAYIGGLLTILSPCILPVLPFVFARADRPFVAHGLPMLAGMAVSFAAVASLAAVGGGWVVSANEYGRLVALVVLGLFGASLIVPVVAERLSRPLVALGNRWSESAAIGGPKSGSPISAMVLGIGTGLLWTPCAGPILGLILTSAAIHGAGVSTSVLLLVYAAGAGTSLALAVLGGRRVFVLLTRSLDLGDHLRRIAGVAVLAGVVAIALGVDTGTLSRLSYGIASTLEGALVDGLQKRPGSPTSEVDEAELPARAMPAVFREATPPSALPVEGRMPTLGGATEWINSPPLTADGLRGKVVLVDFWTYSCINCLRTLPYVRAWAEKYKDQGLVVIGVHSPEFAFEKSSANVHRALQDLHITYPIAVDSDYSIWRSFGNRYWPALYFVDAQGRIRHHQFGENGYRASEEVLQSLLAESDRPVASASLVTPRGEGTQAAPGDDPPASGETYLGSEREGSFVAAGRTFIDGSRGYKPATSLELNQWTLSGDWKLEKDRVSLRSGVGAIRIRFKARDLHLVLGPGTEGKPVSFRVLVDGRPPLDDHGTDVDARGRGTIDTHRLYQLVRQVGGSRERLFEIEFANPGADAFVFTFG